MDLLDSSGSYTMLVAVLHATSYHKDYLGVANNVYLVILINFTIVWKLFKVLAAPFPVLLATSERWAHGATSDIVILFPSPACQRRANCEISMQKYEHLLVAFGAQPFLMSSKFN